jgi:hypothetical protein
MSMRRTRELLLLGALVLLPLGLGALIVLLVLHLLTLLGHVL